MTARAFDPLQLDVVAFCRAGAALSGAWPLASLSRLDQETHRLADGATRAPQISWNVRGEWRPVRTGAAQPWLHLDVRANVRLQCQRCLGPLDAELAVERAFRFVAGEDEAARLDEECEEDVLALTSRLNLMLLAEDELILALPLVPRHEACPVPLTEPMHDAAAADAGQAEDHPFAALARLREAR